MGSVVWKELGVQAPFHSSETFVWCDPKPCTDIPPPSLNRTLTFHLSETNYGSSQDLGPPLSFPLPEGETPEMGTDYSLRPSRQIRGTHRFCSEREPAPRKNFLKAGPGTPTW